MNREEAWSERGGGVRNMSLGSLQGGEVIRMTVTLNTLFERASVEYVISHPVPQQLMHTKTRMQAASSMFTFLRHGWVFFLQFLHG